MYSRHLHVLRKGMGCCGNTSFPIGLSNSVSAHSWKLYSSPAPIPIHRQIGGYGAIVPRSKTHDHSVAKVCAKNVIGIRKFSNTVGTTCKTERIRAGRANTENTVKFEKLNTLIARRCLVTMSGNKGPGLIVFDLDCTLWPHHVDTTVSPPFVQKNSKVVDQNGETITYYPEVPDVLEYLKFEGYALAAASRTTKPPAAEQLLGFFDWNKYFKYKEIYPGSKVTHFAKFVEKASIPHQEMLFFDDEQRNIIDMEKEGVKCVLVKNGVNLQLVKDSIEKFKNGTL